MAKVDRMVARALLTIADDPVEPKWDESNPKAAKYLKAWKERPSRRRRLLLRDGLARRLIRRRRSWAAWSTG